MYPLIVPSPFAFLLSLTLLHAAKFNIKAKPKIFIVSSGFVLEKLGRPVGNKFLWAKMFLPK